MRRRNKLGLAIGVIMWMTCLSCKMPFAKKNDSEQNSLRARMGAETLYLLTHGVGLDDEVTTLNVPENASAQDVAAMVLGQSAECGYLAKVEKNQPIDLSNNEDLTFAFSKAERLNTYPVRRGDLLNELRSHPEAFRIGDLQEKTTRNIVGAFLAGVPTAMASVVVGSRLLSGMSTPGGIPLPKVQTQGLFGTIKSGFIGLNQRLIFLGVPGSGISSKAFEAVGKGPSLKASEAPLIKLGQFLGKNCSGPRLPLCAIGVTAGAVAVTGGAMFTASGALAPKTEAVLASPDTLARLEAVFKEADTLRRVDDTDAQGIGFYEGVLTRLGAAVKSRPCPSPAEALAEALGISGAQTQP